MTSSLNANRNHYLWMMFLFGLIFSGFAFAEIREPNPAQSVEEAFNFAVSNGAFSALRYLIVGLFSALILTFAAWAFFGLFEAHFIEKQISFKAALILAIRLFAMLTISITLISL